jgi:hypothetical protein
MCSSWQRYGEPADRVDAAAAGAYAAAGVRCHGRLALVVGADQSATMANIEQLADRARMVGAEWVLTVFTATVRPQHMRLRQALFDAVEYTPLGATASIRVGMDVVREPRTAAGVSGLMIDSWHLLQ